MAHCVTPLFVKLQQQHLVAVEPDPVLAQQQPPPQPHIGPALSLLHIKPTGRMHWSRASALNTSL